MDILIQQIINGLVLGSMYALIALGYTMVYGIINLINFAHGDVLIDQLVQMQRNGFDVAVLRADQNIDFAQRQFDRFRGFYQGDAVTVKVTFPEQYQSADLAGKDAEFAVTVHEVRAPVEGAADDALAQRLGVRRIVEGWLDTYARGVARRLAYPDASLRAQMRAEIAQLHRSQRASASNSVSPVGSRGMMCPCTS